MRLLLDSHVALWWLADSPELGSGARRRIERAATVHVSAVTPWELGTKRALGKIEIPDGLNDALVEAGFASLPITAEHAAAAPSLPLHHRDPFDRMLIAQAQLEVLTLVSADSAFELYDIATIDARA